MEIVLSIIATFVCSYFAMHRVMIAWDTWHEARRIHNKNTWMRNACLNDTFYTNMQMHSDVCDRVQRQAIRTPIMHALQVFITMDGNLLLLITIFVILIICKCLFSVLVYKRVPYYLPK
jgi:hypothetical protein